MQKTVLIYDDDQEILYVSAKILEKQNYHVETRSYCDNLLEDIGALQPDIILMDLWIPKIGGENAAGLLKRNDDTKHIPLIFFSANSAISEIAERVGANGFLKKPFEIAELLEVIKKNTQLVTK